MACPEVLTGQRFVAQAIAHIDCQAQNVGAYGYGALTDPNSSYVVVLTALLTVFVAIFGLRLVIGEPIGQRDLVGDVLRVAIVLTLATSWPAWRTLGYDLVMTGPGEIAATIGNAADLPGSRSNLVARLQAADDGIVLLTVYGTGRNTGGTNRSNTIGDSFRGVALADQEGLANGRIAFLAGALGPLAIVRLGAGLLLALAPLMAGLLLFVGTRDLFFGWLRALGTVAMGALALTVTLGIELAVLEPWLADALVQRQGLVLTPSMPTELVVITVSFALVSFGLLALVARIFFFGGMALPRLTLPRFETPQFERQELRPAYGAAGPTGELPTRAFMVAEAVAQTLRREERALEQHRLIDRLGAGRERGTAVDSTAAPVEPLGSSFRASEARPFRRASGAADKRDRKA
jgi:type IV secretion system protein VirB6